MNVYLFGFECVALLFVTVCWAGWAYTNDKVPPVIILLATMCETAFVVTCLVYVCMITFGMV